MKRTYPMIAALGAMALGAGQAGAATGTVIVVNGVGSDIRSVEMRPTGRAAWSPVALASRAGQGAAGNFDDNDCAVDLRATLASGEQIVFSGVNPCGARRLTLRRSAGTGWVDYE